MLTDQLFGANQAVQEGLSGLKGAWLQAYEIGIDDRTRVEKKKNLLNFENCEDASANHPLNSKGKRSSSSLNSGRGQMVHKVNSKNGKNTDVETFIELELTDDGRRIQPH